MTPLNVLDTWAFAEQYGDPGVLYQCLRLIDRHAGYIFASPRFAELPKVNVKALLGRVTLDAKEADVFEAAVKWIKAEMERNPDDEGNCGNLRDVFR